MQKFETVRLSEAVEFLDGQRRPVKSSERKDGPYPYYGANGQQGTIDGYIFNERLILLAEDGGHFDNPQRGIAYLVEGKTWVNNHAHVLRTKSTFIADFLCWYLMHLDVRPYITGTTRAKLTKSNASRILVPKPPLDKQQRIVDILDRAASIQRLRQAADQKLKEIIPALFVDMFGDPATNPKGWPTDNLAKLVTATSGGTPSKSRSDFWEGDVPWVSPKDMKRLEIDDAQDHISETVFSETALKRIPASSVLIVVRGMILVHTVPVAIAKVDCAMNQDMKALEPNAMLLPEFLFWTLRLLHETLLQSVSTAAHRTKKIDMAVIENLVIPVPPLELQRDFKKKAEKLLQMQKKSRDLTATALATAASLSSAAFR